MERSASSARPPARPLGSTAPAATGCGPASPPRCPPGSSTSPHPGPNHPHGGPPQRSDPRRQTLHTAADFDVSGPEPGKHAQHARHAAPPAAPRPPDEPRNDEIPSDRSDWTGSREPFQTYLKNGPGLGAPGHHRQLPAADHGQGAVGHGRMAVTSAGPCPPVLFEADDERFPQFQDPWGLNYPAIIKLWSDAWPSSRPSPPSTSRSASPSAPAYFSPHGSPRPTTEPQ